MVIANAEEGEVVVDEPFEECDGFGDLVRRHRRPVGFELGDHVLDTFQHRPPVGDAEADVGEHPLDGRHDVGAAGLVVDRLEMDVDHAFAQRAGSRLGLLEGDEAAGIVAHDGQNGMYDEAHIDAAVGKLRQDRVDQERHVVIDDLEHRFVATPLPVSRRPDRIEADVRHARFAHRQQGPGVGREFGELTGVVTQKVFGCRVSKNPGDEIRRDLAMAAAQDFARRGDQRRFGTLFIGAGKVGGYHRVSLGAPRMSRRRS